MIMALLAMIMLTPTAFAVDTSLDDVSTAMPHGAYKQAAVGAEDGMSQKDIARLARLERRLCIAEAGARVGPAGGYGGRGRGGVATSPQPGVMIPVGNQVADFATSFVQTKLVVTRGCAARRLYGVVDNVDHIEERQSRSSRAEARRNAEAEARAEAEADYRVRTTEARAEAKVAEAETAKQQAHKRALAAEQDAGEQARITLETQASNAALASEKDRALAQAQAEASARSALAARSMSEQRELASIYEAELARLRAELEELRKTQAE